jgi:hypothetical protein
MNKKWWIIGGLIVVGAGVGAYFLFRKPKDENKDENKDEEKDEEKVEEKDSSSESTSLGRTNTSSSIKCEGNFPSTPFSSNTEGNAFRLWVNANFPAYAKEIDLSKTGEFNNCFIKKAYDKYGKAYSFALVPTYVGAGAKLSSDKAFYTVDLPSKSVYVRFFNNGRYFIIKSFSSSIKKEVQRGSYKLGGRIMKSDSGKSASSGSVLTNLYTLLS